MSGKKNHDGPVESRTLLLAKNEVVADTSRSMRSGDTSGFRESRHLSLMPQPTTQLPGCVLVPHNFQLTGPYMSCPHRISSDVGGDDTWKISPRGRVIRRTARNPWVLFRYVEYFIPATMTYVSEKMEDDFRFGTDVQSHILENTPDWHVRETQVEGFRFRVDSYILTGYKPNASYCLQRANHPVKEGLTEHRLPSSPARTPTRSPKDDHMTRRNSPMLKGFGRCRCSSAVDLSRDDENTTR